MNRAAVLLTLFITLTPAAFAQQPPEPPRTITTSGDSVVYVVPDEVIVTLGVETFSPNLDESKSANDAASKKLLAAIKKLDVEDRHVQTDTLQLEIRYRSGRASEGIDGYIAHRTYSVTLKDAKKLEPVVDAALRNGANQLLGVQYRSSELRKHRDAARAMAIKAAKEKATALAAELGAKIGPPRTITEGYAGYGGGYGWGRMNNFAQNSAQVVAGPGDGGGDANEATPLGQIGISANVSVVFDLLVVP
jgi:uncharacterized protein YggE